MKTFKPWRADLARRRDKSPYTFPLSSPPPAWVEPAVGAPARDLIGAPFASRAAILGLKQGAAFAHHERRVRIPMPAHMEPELSVWRHGQLTTPVWEGGVLTEPKYFSFFQDAPLPAMNPNHRSKWRVHELLHASVGFFFHPEQTRFHAYIGARLGELLPVVHWYGFDEIGRPRCDRHAHGDPPKHTCNECEALARGEVATSLSNLPGDVEDAALYERALEHFEMEWRACAREIESNRITRTPHARLDASSDAIGYLRGHWPRLSSACMAEWVDRFCIDGVEVESDLGAYAARVERALHALLGGELVLEYEPYIRARQRRAIQDAGWRALLALAWSERPLTPDITRALDDLTDRCHALHADPESMRSGAEDQARVMALFARIERVSDIPEAVTSALSGVGHDILSAEISLAEIAQVAEGIVSSTPTSAMALAGAEFEIEHLAAEFITRAEFAPPSPLASRFARFLEGQDDEVLPLIGALAEIEAWLAAPPRADEVADAFAMTPDSPEALAHGTLRLHESARRATWPLDLLEAALERDEEGEDEIEEGAVVDVIACVNDGELILIGVDEEVDYWWRVASGEEPVGAARGARWEQCVSLLEASVLVWIPD